MAIGKFSRAIQYLLNRGGLIYLPVAIFAFFAPAPSEVSATAHSGLSVVGYSINQNPPMRVDSPSASCSATYQKIENWPGIYMAGCPSNMVMLHYTGYINIPVESAQFRIWSDDGGWVSIGDNSFGYWGLRGCSYTESPVYEFTAGESLPIDAWFYEWGGGECFILWWNIGNGWGPVPESAFTQLPPETTTTSTTTTTLPKVLGTPTNVTVTDTGSGILVDWDAAQDDSIISPERYAVSWSTDAAGWGVATGNVGDQNALNTEILLSYQLFDSTGGLDVPYLFTVRADNDSEGIYSQVSESVELTVTMPTTTTTTTTTEVPVETTVPETTVPEPTTNPENETTTSTEAPVTTVPEIPPPATPPSTTTTTTVPSTTTTEPVSTTTTSVVNTTTTSTTTPINDLSPNIIQSLSTEELLTVLDPENLTDLSSDEVDQLISSIAEADLSPEQAAVIAEALSDAPNDVKEQFEEEINVFNGLFDNYVPTGSIISVGERRVLVAATAVIFAMPAPVISRRVS